MKNRLKMVVAGHRRGDVYADVLDFRINPTKMQMTVSCDNAEHYIAYTGTHTPNIERLARMWINDFYGETTEDIRVV